MVFWSHRLALTMTFRGQTCSFGTSIRPSLRPGAGRRRDDGWRSGAKIWDWLVVWNMTFSYPYTVLGIAILRPSFFMVGIPPMYGDDWGMVYYCYTNIIGNSHPNWRTHLFQRGGEQPQTSSIQFWGFFPVSRDVKSVASLKCAGRGCFRCIWFF